MIVPGSANALLLDASAGGYTIARSLRFRSSASAYLSRTPASSGNRQTWTWSAWVKRGLLTVSANSLYMFDATASGITENPIVYVNTDALAVWAWNGTGFDYQLVTTAIFRDPSAWYHVIVSVDTTQATASNRVKIYVNGLLQALSVATYPAQSYNTAVNSANAHNIGRSLATSARFFDGYMAEIYMIDGQALTPSSFGANDATTGVWQPKAYTGTYGTNGFYLKFSDATSATTLSYDYSGNGNNWTPNNISVTAGVTYDSMIDTPTPYDDGGNGRGNYAVLNPLAFNPSTISAGNLEFAGANLTSVRGSIQIPSSGMWYWELTPTTTMPNYVSVGVAERTTTGSAAFGVANTWGLYPAATIYTWAGTSSTNTSVSTPALGCTFAVAYDAATGKLWLGYAASGAGSITWVGGGSPASGTSPTYTLSTTLELFPFVSSNNTASDKSAINFGQRPFTYTPPSGFKALNTQNLPTPTIAAGNAYMDAVLYTGNATYPRSITGLNFQPDFVWVKARSIGYSNVLYDVLRGTGNTKNLSSDTTSAEPAFSTIANLSSFNSNGFTVDTTSSTNILNANSATFVAWNWKANGPVSANNNSNGTIISTVSANTTAGFSVVTWTGTGSNATIGHGLGVAPSLIITKGRNVASDWPVYHVSVGNGSYLYLDTTAASAAGTMWNSTSPTSSVFSVGSPLNGAYNWVAYCFAAVSGYSAFGSYTGNGSADGPFVFTGFRPRYVLIKRTDAADNWYCQDSSRGTYNANTYELFPNLSNAEQNSVAYNTDFLSNGFKLRTSDASINASGGTYIYAAFAENPLKYSLAR